MFAAFRGTSAGSAPLNTPLQINGGLDKIILTELTMLTISLVR